MGAPRKNFDDAVTMYGRGMSIGDVAIAFSVTRQAMWMALKRRGVKFRSNLRFGEQNGFHRGGVARNVNFALSKALKKGIVAVGPCEVCGLPPAIENGRQRIQGHHDDYNHLLDVRWLCRAHHHEWHKHNRPIPRTKPATPHLQIASMGGKASWAKHRDKNLKLLAAARLARRNKKHEAESVLQRQRPEGVRVGARVDGGGADHGG